jgi:peptidoglycan hydrolase-like protein with peptidoglycan-binding domain
VKRTLLVLACTAVVAGTGLATAGTASAADQNWPTYRQGAGGTDVRTVQSLLRFHHYGDKGDSGLKVDPPGARAAGPAAPRRREADRTASFDAATQSAVKDAQRRYGLKADGIANADTWKTLVAHSR